MYTIRVGQGYDVHQFTNSETKYIMLCGVKLPHIQSVIAHSDGDVGIHALVDAMLGAIAGGDIGEHFPPSDDKWKDVNSSILLQHTNKLIQNKGYNISNIDITIICEKPKIQDYKYAMRQTIAEILDITIEQVSVKATTTEKLGFLGRGEGIAAHSVVLLYKN